LESKKAKRRDYSILRCGPGIQVVRRCRKAATGGNLQTNSLIIVGTDSIVAISANIDSVPATRGFAGYTPSVGHFLLADHTSAIILEQSLPGILIFGAVPAHTGISSLTATAR
jgi:hypothetical protein